MRKETGYEKTKTKDPLSGIAFADSEA